MLNTEDMGSIENKPALLPELIGLIVFSVKRKVIKKNISSSKLNHKSLIRCLGDYIVKHIKQNSSLHEGLSLYLAGLFSILPISSVFNIFLHSAHV
jgi:hypothetical protein